MKLKYTNLLIVLFLFSTAFAQNSAIKRGDRILKSFNFKAAADAYKAGLKKDANNLDLKQKMARALVLAEDHVGAEAAYADIVKNPTAPSINKLYLGNELRANGKYDEAIAAYNDYSKVSLNDPRGKELSNNLEKVKTLAIDNKMYQLTNLTQQNSPASEMGPTFYRDNGLAFSSNKGKAGVSVIRNDVWTDKTFYNIYTCTGDVNGNLNAPAILKGKQPNRKFHEGPQTFTSDYKEMIFTRSNYVKSKVRKSSDRIVKLKLMHADWNESKKRYENIVELPFNSNEYSIAHPSLSKDGKRLYFCSDMPGGYGEEDLYVSYKDGTTWGPPINLGKSVNTPGREMFPYIAEDGTLYYSSDAKTGLGGLDIYSASYQNGEWSGVQNLGSPINTNSDDFGYIIDGKNENGYIASNRPGGNGDDDIYKFRRTGITLCGSVVDARTKLVLPGSEVKLLDSDNKLVATKIAGANGDFCFPVLPNKCYRVDATKGDYSGNGTNVCTKKDPQIIQIPLEKPGGIDLTVCATVKGKGTATGAVITVKNKATGESKTCNLLDDCKCKFDLAPESDYEICATKDAGANGDCKTDCKSITTKGKVAPASLYENLEFLCLEEGEVIKIENLYYDLDKSYIRPDAAVELNKLLAIMKRFPNMEIELSSHTDCRATMKYNDELSARRAKACVDYLMSNGISGARMIAAGYGERRLINGCACEGAVKSTCTEQQHQLNRRTEFKILKLK